MIEFAEKVDEDAFERGRSISASLDTDPPVGLREYVSGYTSVLLVFGDPTVEHQAWDIAAVMAKLEAVVAGASVAVAVKEIPTVYDGPDLQRVAEYNSISVDDVIHLHTRVPYRVHMLGFAPGFPYLGGLDGKLHTPRLEKPRTVVPAGSVAIGGEHTGIYSIPNPGGWNLIGRTEVKLFDLGRGDDRQAFYLQPGDRVKFVVS
jgi:inhibitor of KinA